MKLLEITQISTQEAADILSVPCKHVSITDSGGIRATHFRTPEGGHIVIQGLGDTFLLIKPR